MLCDRTRKLNSLDNLKIDFTEDFLHLKDNISLKYSFWSNPPWRGEEGAYLRGFIQCVNKKSSSERRNYVRAKQRDLFPANAEDLIKKGRIHIGVVSLFLAILGLMSVWLGPTYILFLIYILSFIFALCDPAAAIQRCS